MASSKEAFAKLWRWKKSRTVLKLTVLTKDGMPDIHVGEVSALDPDASLVSFTLRGEHNFFTLDLGSCTFRIGKRKLEAERGGDVICFEETGE